MTKAINKRKHLFCDSQLQCLGYLTIMVKHGVAGRHGSGKVAEAEVFVHRLEAERDNQEYHQL